MPKIRGNPGAKWVRKASVATQDYQEGVQSPRASWATQTQAAGGNYATGVQQAIAGRRFERGVQQAGDGKWAEKSLRLGVQRFAQGCAEAQGDYERGVAPYLQVIQSLTLPPRRAKGDPANINRVSAIASALRAKKVGAAGTGQS
jgi:hypothetical protein